MSRINQDPPSKMIEGNKTVFSRLTLSAGALCAAALVGQPASAFVLCNDLAPGSRVCTSSDGGGNVALENSLGRGSTVGTDTSGHSWSRDRSGGLDMRFGEAPDFMNGSE